MHGKGTGALQKGVQQRKDIKVLVTLEVVCQAKVDFGVTVATLK
ncbi:hypothetical protein ACVPOS_09685 [Staphylococcus aureus]